MDKKNFLIIILMSSMIFTGCGKEEPQTSRPPLVKVQQIKFSNSEQEENYSGVVKGRYETKLSFQVGGKIISREVQAGSLVYAGYTLMTLDPKDIVEQSRIAEAQIFSAQAQLQLAKKNFERYNELFKEEAVAAAELDRYKTQLDAAQSSYDAAVAQSQQIKNSLDYTILTANADGVITEISAEVGQVVSAGQSVLTLVQTDEFEVEVQIPENKISAIEIGQRVAINFWAMNEEVRGTIREISPIADSASRTFTVKITLPEIRNIHLGMTANVAIQEKKPLEIILPLSAIYQTGDDAQVWVVKDNKVSLKKIQVKSFEYNNVQVVGLNLGEVVVVAGVQKLRDGQEVRTVDK